MTPERYLEFAAVEIAQSTQDQLLSTRDAQVAAETLLMSYRLAFDIGAMVAALSLLDHRFAAPHLSVRPRRPTAPDSYIQRARYALEARGMTFELTDKAVIERIQTQARAATAALVQLETPEGLEPSVWKPGRVRTLLGGVRSTARQPKRLERALPRLKGKRVCRSKPGSGAFRGPSTEPGMTTSRV
ncbi:MAG: hypothetical protein HC933_17570 [Pleurocapsa sp. SU_196_0]|nr:hypothetical protein [Pleurocapsa sp. SU_196_0]